jgi:hypothetical protein
MPDYSEAAVYKEWIIGLFAGAAFVVALAALGFAAMRSRATVLLGTLAIMVFAAAIGAGGVLTARARDDCERVARNEAWGSHDLPSAWKQETDRCRGDAWMTMVLSLKLGALPFLVAVTAVWLGVVQRRSRERAAASLPSSATRAS